MYFNGSLWKKFEERLNIRIVYLIKIEHVITDGYDNLLGKVWVRNLKMTNESRKLLP